MRVAHTTPAIVYAQLSNLLARTLGSVCAGSDFPVTATCIEDGVIEDVTELRVEAERNVFGDGNLFGEIQLRRVPLGISPTQSLQPGTLN